MANRRMFARAIVGSGRFLLLSAQSKVLYFDLGMEADDDGFVEAIPRLRVTDSQVEQLLELEKGGFIQICDPETLIVHIRHWRENNLIRTDRYTPSIYRKVFPQFCEEEAGCRSEPLPTRQEPVPMQEPEAFCQSEEPQEEPVGQPEGNREETICQPDGCFLGDSRLTQVRSGKGSTGKARSEQGRIAEGSSNQVNLNQAISGKRPSENWQTPGRAREDEKSASPEIGEADMDFEEKRRNCMNTLLNSEYFRNIRAAPKSSFPV